MTTMEKSLAGTSDMGGAVARTVDHASTSAHKAIDRASDATRPAVDQVASSAHHAVDRIAGAASQAAQTLDTKGGQLRDAQAQFTESCRGYVRDKPITSLGIAVAAGFLISWMLSRR